MLTELVQKHQSNAVLAALVGSVLAVAGSLLSVGLSYYYSTVSQDRQIKLEQVSKFDASSADLISSAGAFINAINENKSASDDKDLVAARKQMSAVIATQIFTSEDLKRSYGTGVAQSVKDYEDALTDLNRTAGRTSSVTEMRAWTETFGRVLDAKSNLSGQIYESLGTQRHS